LEWLGHVLRDEVVGAGVAELLRAEFDEPMVRDTVLFHGVLGDVVSGRKFMDVGDWVWGLNRYEVFAGVSEFGLADESVREQGVGLLRVTAALSDGSWEGARERVNRGRIVDEGLVELVLSRPGDAALIAGVVSEHHVTDPVAILAVLEGMTPSLASGAL
jgi:hypothetical protein